ncbi:hypothetical protein FRC17_006998 [Serendipita sp. 399]|nr:hypothetical protein FRC17_006998 [Serendipita sp. 399]
MSIQLVFSNTSVQATSLFCESLDIRYDVSHSRSEKVTTVQKWDSSIKKHIVVGEFKTPVFAKDELRVKGETEWHPLNEILYREGRRFFNTTRTFEGTSGVKYKWRVHDGSLELRLASDSANDQGVPLVIHRKSQKGQAPSLEIIDPSVLYSLDMIVVTFLVMEKWRRIRVRRRRAALIAAVVA